ncbi:MAG TPA: type VI secretion system-associated protein TagF [Burkholderiaceae bacterium]|nr:type VI secretion system-associated protein TagF [Burkholderiaceae bacterium]
MTIDNGVGWFGKVPSVGDFVRRGLPDEFVSAWDDWLQRAVTAGRQAQGARFDAALQAFPTWRFLIAPGVIGPGAWCGVMQASADRVGRTFPFTLAQSIAQPADHVCDTEWLERQLDAFARAAVSALDPSSLARFEALAATLDAPPAPAQVDGRLESLSRLGRPAQQPVPLGAPLHQWMRQLGERDLSRRLAGRCLWWIPPAAHDEAGAALIVEHPLPDDLLQVLLQAV